jgi:predicted transcriptional regulator of viral defense system
MKLDAFFARHPVFTSDEVRAYLEEIGTGNPNTLRNLLAYHSAQGRIARVRRGVYVVVPPGVEAGSVAVDPFLVASRLAPDATIAYHSALELAGVAYTLYSTVWFLTSSHTRPVEFGGQSYRGVSYPKSLVEKRAEQFAVRTVDRSGLAVRVTSLERTLVDVLDRPDLAGGWEEAWRSLESIEYLDLDIVTEYCRFLGNATTAAKVGLFLELHREPLMVSDTVLVELESLRPAGPHYVFDARGRESRFTSRWNLQVPASLLGRGWEEPL